MAELDVPESTERLLLRTSNSALWDADAFSSDSAKFVESGARRLVEAGVRLVGIDYLSVGDDAAHRVLLGAGVVALEGLDLRRVEAGPYDLVCLPLKIDADGAPARAILVRPSG